MSEYVLRERLTATGVVYVALCAACPYQSPAKGYPGLAESAAQAHIRDKHPLRPRLHLTSP